MTVAKDETPDAWRERIRNIEARLADVQTGLRELQESRNQVALEVELGRARLDKLEACDESIRKAESEIRNLRDARDAAEGRLANAEVAARAADIAQRNAGVSRLGAEAEKLAAELQERLQEIRGTLLRFGEISDELRTLRGRRGEAWESFHPNGMGVFLNSALQWELRGLLPGLQTEKPPTRTLEEWARGWTAYMIEQPEDAA
jgi:chromosome segregation ATPase